LQKFCSLGKPKTIRFFLDRGADPVRGRPFAEAFGAKVRTALRPFVECKRSHPELAAQVLTDKQQLSNSYMLTVSPAQSQAIVKALQSNGAKVNLAVGGAADRFSVETSMSAIELYTFLNSRTLDAGGIFKTHVVDFSENTLGVEIVKVGAIAKKSPLLSAPTTAPSRRSSKPTFVELRLRSRSTGL
jgi:hypothetical protein